MSLLRGRLAWDAVGRTGRLGLWKTLWKTQGEGGVSGLFRTGFEACPVPKTAPVGRSAPSHDGTAWDGLSAKCSSIPNKVPVPRWDSLGTAPCLSHAPLYRGGVQRAMRRHLRGGRVMPRKPSQPRGMCLLTRNPSDPEERLAWILAVLGPEAIAGPSVREHRPLPPPQRRWRLDFAWPDLMVGIEVQGGVRSRGPSGHKGSGHVRDMEKLNALQTAGWIVLQFPTERIVRDPTGVAEDIRAALRSRLEHP